jgi:hypothetical protein
MSFLKKIFSLSKNTKQTIVEIPNNFSQLTVLAINLIGKNSKEMENDVLYDYLVSNGFPEFEAGELIVFLPTAFCRKLLPDLNWLPHYYDFYSEKKKIKRIYTDNKRYQIIENETDKYWNDNPNKDFVMNIAGRSAEFNATNELLKDGGKLEDVRLTETFVIR